MQLNEVTSKCVKCAKCVPQCTIYRIKRDETNSPRGFLDLINAAKSGHLELDKNTKDIFDSCFLCTTCVLTCPNSLPVDFAIESIRIDLAKKYGQSLFKKIYFFALRHRKFADFTFSFVAFIAPCIFQKSGEKLTPKFFSSMLKNRAIFPFHKKSFLQKHGQKKLEDKLKSKTTRRVAIFIGCISNYNYPNVGESLLKILERLNIDTFVPKLQECCGAPSYFSGDIATTTTLIKKNIAYFESFFNNIEAMIIPEATCAAMIKVDWLHALELEEQKLSVDNSTWIKRLRELLPKIHMASLWLDKNTELNKILSKHSTETKTQITYHDPCHARKVLGIYKEPRRLLSHNFSIKEMADSTSCCGFGGISMQSENYDLTLQAGLPKARDIENQNVAIVSAECSACRTQITNSLHQINSDTTFIHPLELIAKQLR